LFIFLLRFGGRAGRLGLNVGFVMGRCYWQLHLQLLMLTNSDTSGDVSMQFMSVWLQDGIKFRQSPCNINDTKSFILLHSLLCSTTLFLAWNTARFKK